jgi:hypothetical protein
MTAIFVSYRNSRYSLSWLTFISLFPLLYVTNSHMTIILSLFQYCVCVCVFFYSWLLVRMYLDFSRRVFLEYTSLFYFRCVVYLLCAHTCTRACQRDKQLILACRDGQLLTVLTVFPNLSGIDNKILTTKKKTSSKIKLKK